MFKSVLTDESNSSHLSAAGKVPAEVEVAASEYSIGADDIYQVFISTLNKVKFYFVLLVENYN